MNTDNKLRKARLKAARVRWAREDRERGYTTYRGGRPHKRVRRDNPLNETLLGFGVALLLCVLAGLAG